MSYLNLDDESLGKLCKRIANIINEPDSKRPEFLPITAAVAFLVSGLINVGCEKTVIKVKDLTSGGVNLGHFEISIRKSNE